jgi:hypothetical protein
MTKDERDNLEQIEKKIDDFHSIFNGPDGWFLKVETRLQEQENRMKMIFAIFGGAWAIFLVIFGLAATDFLAKLSSIQSVMATLK